MPTPFSYTDVGVTGTPVIDPSTNTLYVVAAIEIPNGTSGVINYYLIAVDITSGSVKANTQIAGSVPGSQTPPTPKCTTGGSGTTQSFDINHIQRSGLLLLKGVVYVSFAPLPEPSESGWMFGYSLVNPNGSVFSQTAAFSSTPHGTGGGIWGSGAAPASDGTDMDIFVATGNGTFDLMLSSPIDNDAGDSLLKLQPPTAPSTLLTVSDFFTPYDVFSWDNNVGLCYKDEDFGSGGVLLPPNFTYTNTGECSGSGCKVAITADKQSNLYVTDQDYLGGANLGTSCSGSTNDIQCITTPSRPSNDPAQGYWGSPAYLWYKNGGQIYNMLYYSADAPLTVGAMGGPGTADVAPMPINGYQLQPSSSVGPPIPTTPTASTSTLFCQYSPTPSVSSSGTVTPLSGIVWAIEQNQNADNNPNYKGPPDCAGTQSFTPALHAFCVSAGASSGPCTTAALQEIYTSRGTVKAKMKSAYFGFPTPIVFNGQVYFGATDEVEVFGICPQSGCL